MCESVQNTFVHTVLHEPNLKIIDYWKREISLNNHIDDADANTANIYSQTFQVKL